MAKPYREVRVKTKKGIKTYRYEKKTGSPVKGTPGTFEFVKSLASARKGQGDCPSLRDAMRRYTKSPHYPQKASTRRTYAYIQDLLEKRYGQVRVDQIDRAFVNRVRNDLYGNRGTCRLAISYLRMVLDECVEEGWLTGNPAVRISKMPKSQPYRRWTDLEVKTFLAATDGNLRMAVALLYYTGQRIGDIARMTWADYDGTYLKLTQEKTTTPLYVRVHPELKEMLDTQPRAGVRILTDPKTMHTYASAKGLGAAIRAKVKELNDLPDDLVPHGLRKSAASKLAEQGCSEREIMAVTGHKSPQSVSLYVKEANQRLMSDAAIEKFGRK